MSNITLYTTGCQRCNVLEKKLNAKNIDYTKETDIEVMQNLGMLSAPSLKVDDKLLNFSEAVAWVNSL